MNRAIRFSISTASQAARAVLSVLLFLVLSFTITALSLPCLAAEEVPLVINGVSAMLIDAQRGQILYAKQETERLHIGITSKLMTVLLAMESSKPGALITASSEAADVENASLNLRIGAKYVMENLAYAAMLAGSNDAAVALAEYVGGTTGDFVGMMNVMAEKLGMRNTRFMNPTGRNDDAQYTTAEDLSVFMRYALTNAGFSRIFGTQAKPWYDDRKTTLLTNRNTMFWSYDGTDGGVSGSSDPPLESLVTSATRNNMRLICIVLDVPMTFKSEDCTNLLNNGFSNYRYGTLVAAGQTLKSVTVMNQTVNLLAKTNEYYIYPVGQNFVKDLTIAVDEGQLKPPVLKSTPVGKAIFTLADKTVIEVDLVPESDILPKQTKWEVLLQRLMDNREILLLICLLVAVELFWVFWRIAKRILKRARRKKHHPLKDDAARYS
jgi:D-alanyl-D-alanine carboxypeptidase/D-alanyl-D-alanine carboxypeptidase (penicillin-binding protein 5/6)